MKPIRMKPILFEVWFSSGKHCSKYGFKPEDAAILAQVETIQNQFDYSIDTVMNTETGQIYRITNTEAILITNQ